jgi:hypothetical protein
MGLLNNSHAVSILQAVMALAVLTLVIWAIAVSTRVRAMAAARLHPQAAARVVDLVGKLPADAEAKTDNYNHLFEAPTVFYAVALVAVLAGQAHFLDAVAAWAFVVLRVVHSIIHTTVNKVIWRFYAFALSWIALAVLIVDTTLAVLRL